jgi:ABC-type Na+ transport system ATPase subunit NatA
VEKFGDIISELGKRGVSVLMHRPTRWGYVVDAVIPSSKIVILKMPDLTKQVKVAMSQFRDLINRLESDGYQVVVIPKNSMNEEQIKAFCDRIAVEPALAAA